MIMFRDNLDRALSNPGSSETDCGVCGREVVGLDGCGCVGVARAGAGRREFAAPETSARSDSYCAAVKLLRSREPPGRSITSTKAFSSAMYTRASTKSPLTGHPGGPTRNRVAICGVIVMICPALSNGTGVSTCCAD